MSCSPNRAHSYPDLAKDESGVNVTHRKRKQKPECELTVAISELSREEFNTLSSATSQISNDVKELRTEFSIIDINSDINFSN
ncbi:unnamed protein product [Arctia plantaginis]|uniref:Uncharacterized protein n=1 Tax=Arctia plantaginis TaxID=874455 RepID=A0A8S0YV10_ARCPL|nr:unnamed protein product [Arctia plantaginis]